MPENTACASDSAVRHHGAMHSEHEPMREASFPAFARDLWNRVAPAMAVRSSEAESIVRELFGLAGIEINGTKVGDITVKDPRFYERVIRDASVGFGEAYMDEWWETDALDVTIDKIMRANLKQKIQGSWRMRALTVKALLLNLQAKTRSGASVEAHYD